ncbi:MAG TPA: SurA N-terminal domain-containing protein [Rhizomicrobium sp.]|nr:SurA N-terminal domain-containing protein [Rhizomicrobium sp.]
MHTLSKSWMATLLMGGLTLSFVVWGIADVFTGVSTAGVATVGGTDIGTQEFQRTYRNFLRNQSQQMGTEITPEMAQKLGLGQVALQQMVSRTALNNEAQQLGLTASDAAVVQNVRAMAPFRGTLGQFDRPTFIQAVQAAGYSEQQFLDEVRQDMTRDQLTQAVEGNFLVPPTYAQAIFQYINEKRAADYVILSPEQAGDVPAPSDAVLSAYVKEHAERFSTPEYRDVDYAAIAPSDVIGSVTVSDAQIQQDYDAHKATYVIAEKRDVQQIEFKTEAEAVAARAKIQSGTGYEDLAASRGLKPAQISLGTLTQVDLPDADRAKAIFALALNEVSQPIKTGFGGFVLARVTKIAPGSTKTLADVKEDIHKNLTNQLAANKLVDAVNAYTDARSGGAELKEAAKKAGMKVAHLSGVDITGLKPDGSKADVPADPEFLPALFKGEVGEDTDPFPTKQGAYYAVHVNGVTPPKLKSLDQVRAQALADWTTQQRSLLLSAKAQALAIQAAKDK